MVFNLRGSYPGISNPLTCIAQVSLDFPICSDDLLLPSLNSRPIPFCSAIIWIRFGNIFSLPKYNSKPSVSVCVKTPFSYDSIAQAIVAPVLIVSRPNWSHIFEDSMSMSGLLIPINGPNA